MDGLSRGRVGGVCDGDVYYYHMGGASCPVTVITKCKQEKRKTDEFTPVCYSKTKPSNVL